MRKQTTGTPATAGHAAAAERASVFHSSNMPSHIARPKSAFPRPPTTSAAAVLARPAPGPASSSRFSSNGSSFTTPGAFLSSSFASNPSPAPLPPFKEHAQADRTLGPSFPPVAFNAQLTTTAAGSVVAARSKLLQETLFPGDGAEARAAAAAASSSSSSPKRKRSYQKRAKPAVAAAADSSSYGDEESADGAAGAAAATAGNDMAVIHDYAGFRRTKAADVDRLPVRAAVKTDVLTNGLKPWQVSGMRWMMTRELLRLYADGGARVYPGAGVLADSMGMGKTMQTIALICSHQPSAQTLRDRGHGTRNRATLIVCPVTLIDEWRREIDKHTQWRSVRVHVLHGTGESRAANQTAASDFCEDMGFKDVVITSYQFVYGHLRLMRQVPWLRIVLDEAQQIKNQKTKVFGALRQMDALFRWCVSGSPISNELGDLHSLVKFLRFSPYDRDSVWAQYIEPCGDGDGAADDGDDDRLCPVDAAGESPPDAQDTPFRRNMTAELILRRDKTLLNLPRCTVEYVRVDLAPEERKVYEYINKRIEQELAETEFSFLTGGGSAPGAAAAAAAAPYTGSGYMFEVLERLLRVRQCCNHIYLVNKQCTALRSCSGDRLDIEWQATHVFDWIKARMDNDQRQRKLRKRQSYSSCNWELFEDHEQGEEDDCFYSSDDDDDDDGGGDADADAGEEARGAKRAKRPAAAARKKKASSLDRRIGKGAPIPVDQLCSSSKINALVGKLRQFMASQRQAGKNGKCVIFSQWVTVLRVVASIVHRTCGLAVLQLDGSQKRDERSSIQHQFNTRPECKVLLASTKACSMGLNLQVASAAFILEPWWNPQVENQAIDRLHRLGQENEVHVYRFIVNDSIEERICEIQEQKQQLAGSILASTTSVGASAVAAAAATTAASSSSAAAAAAAAAPPSKTLRLLELIASPATLLGTRTAAAPPLPL